MPSDGSHNHADPVRHPDLGFRSAGSGRHSSGDGRNVFELGHRWDIYVSGVSAGYFMGWSIRFMMGYSRAPQVDLATRTAPQGAAP